MAGTRGRAMSKRIRLIPDGLIYTFHFLEKIGNGTPRGSAQHYTGFSKDFDRRDGEHGTSRGAAIMRHLAEQGIDWKLADVYPGNRDIERLLKQHSATRRCPICTPGAKQPKIIDRVFQAQKRKEAREAKKAAQRVKDVEARRKALMPRAPDTPAQRLARGAESAARYVQGLMDAGKSADQIEVAIDYVASARTTHPTEKSAAETLGWDIQVASDLALLREAEREYEERNHEVTDPGPVSREDQPYEDQPYMDALANLQARQAQRDCQVEIPSWLPSQAELEAG